MGTEVRVSGGHGGGGPPEPGGDPDQPPTDLPAPRPGQDHVSDRTNDKKGDDKEGFGHIGNKDVPSSKGTPEPHQIF